MVQYGVQSNRACQRFCGLTPTSVEGPTEKPVGAVGEPSMPAQLRCLVRPRRPESSTDTRICSLTRIAFGFHSPDPLIALALLPSATHRNSQAETDPHIQQESPICADMGG